MFCTQCGSPRFEDDKFCMRCGFHFRNALVENFHPKEENIKQTQEVETLENPDASSSEPTPRTPGPKGPPPPQIKDTPPEEFREATSRLDDGTSNGELEVEEHPTGLARPAPESPTFQPNWLGLIKIIIKVFVLTFGVYLLKEQARPEVCVPTGPWGC